MNTGKALLKNMLHGKYSHLRLVNLSNYIKIFFFWKNKTFYGHVGFLFLNVFHKNTKEILRNKKKIIAGWEKVWNMVFYRVLTNIDRLQKKIVFRTFLRNFSLRYKISYITISIQFLSRSVKLFVSSLKKFYFWII